MGAAFSQRHQAGLRKRGPLPRQEAGRPKTSALAAVSATSRHVPSIATRRRPASHDPGVPGPASGRATRAKRSRTGSNRAGGWASAVMVDEVYGHVDVHDPVFDAALRTVWGETK